MEKRKISKYNIRGMLNHIINGSEHYSRSKIQEANRIYDRLGHHDDAYDEALKYLGIGAVMDTERLKRTEDN